MIEHSLRILGSGHDPKTDIDDFEIVHIIYVLNTVETDPESNTIVKFADSGLLVAELKPWDIESKTPGKDVTEDQLLSWLNAEINLEELKAKNIASLKPLPK